MRRRIAMGIEYDGSGYSGWQVQSGARSVQQTLEAALSRVADEPVGLICAGRTDAGVHAYGQVAHFDTLAVRSTRAWLLGANTYLPRDISLRWVTPVPDHFHARYSATARCSYTIRLTSRPCSRAATRCWESTISVPFAPLIARPIPRCASCSRYGWRVRETG